MRLPHVRDEPAESGTQLGASTTLTSRGTPARGLRLPGIRYAGPVRDRTACLATYPSPGYLCAVVGGVDRRTHFQLRCFQER